jgi:Fe2+ or Zn2+ uptake regulation protein
MYFDESNRPKRRHSIYRRILILIDTLAPLRRGISAEDLCETINEITGETYCTRTIYRDLVALHEMGVVLKDMKRIHKLGQKTAFWKLNLERSEKLQTVAAKVMESQD